MTPSRRSWWPDTLFARLALVLVLAVLVSHVLVLTVVLDAMAPPPGGGMPPPPPPGSGPPMPWEGLLLDVGVRLLALLGAAWWGARWLSRPLQQLASAAKALGEDLDRPPLVEQGPAECREATRVFNQMQQRIRQQWAEKDRFLAAVSHDLRTPLTRMRLRLEQVSPSPERQALLRDLEDMHVLVEATLDHLREGESSESWAWVDAVSLLQSLADDMADTGHPVAVSGQAPPVWGQPLALRRCVQNLLNNAVRYGQDVEVKAEHRAGWVVLSVVDNGPGVPESELERVLEPYHRLDPARQKVSGGVGLGLTIARDVAVRHGGRLVLANRPGGGLTARVELPDQPPQSLSSAEGGFRPNASGNPATGD